MGEQILQTLQIMGIAGLMLLALAIVNISLATFNNMKNKLEKFSVKRLFSGLISPALYFVAATLVAIVATAFPELNSMIGKVTGKLILSDDGADIISIAGVFGSVIYVLLREAGKATKTLKSLSVFSKEDENEEVVTWAVEDPELEENTEN